MRDLEPYRERTMLALRFARDVYAKTDNDELLHHTIVTIMSALAVCVGATTEAEIGQCAKFVDDTASELTEESERVVH